VSSATGPVGLGTIARSWGRIGCIGFGGPPAHIALLRRLCVTEHGWLSPEEFTDAVAATNLLPGPASTQLAIWCAWRLRGRAGAVVGGLCFIVPGLAVILALAALFLAASPPRWVLGAAAGAGAAVPAVAVNAALGLLPAASARRRPGTAARVRFGIYLLAGGVAAAIAGPWLVLILVACGAVEVTVRAADPPAGHLAGVGMSLAAGGAGVGGLGALAWVAVKVGALSYGGGFVIVPLMQHDAVSRYHWMTGTQFLSAVALGQITPGPVVQTVAVVGFAAAGVAGGLFAALVVFAPSFGFILGGGRSFSRLRANSAAQAFLSGAGPAAVGAICGSAAPLAGALQHIWQGAVLIVASMWLLGWRRNVPAALIGAGALGVAAVLLGAPVAR